jgi:hypothetical protein
MDFTQLASRYASDRINRAFKPFEDPAGYIDERFGVSEEGNVRPETDTMTQVNRPVVAEAPVNPYVEQAEDYSMGVPADANVDGMQLAANQGALLRRERPIAPVAPDALPGETAMDTYIRQQESGGKPDIGYHYAADAQGKRKSTAYGAYGITAPAYRDIQMADPYFRGRPIDSLSQTEQTRANQVYGKVQQAQLKNLGIDATEENLRGAQLLGANGLKRYIETGQVSKEAAKANGGAENLINILKGRMAMQQAPSSQPDLPPQPAPAVKTETAPVGGGQTIDTQGFENLQPAPDVRAGGQEDKNQQFNDVLTNSASDPSAMAQLAYNKEAPESVRRAASDQLYMLMKQQRDEQKAAAVVENAMQDPKEARRLTRELARPSEEGSYVKAYLYQRLGMNDLAKAEQIKLGAGDHWGQSFMFDKNGQQQPVWIKYNGQGAPVKGYSADGELDEKQLLTAMSTKGVTTHTGKMIDRDTGKVYYEQTTPQGIRLVEAGTNQPFVGDSKKLSPYGIGSDIEMKGRIQIQDLANKLKYEPTIEGQKSVARQVMEIAAKNDRGDGVEIARAREMLGQQGVSIDQRGEITVSPRPAQAAPRAEAAPGQVSPAPAPAPVPTTNLRQAQEGDTPAITALRKQLRGDQKLRGESESAYQERLKREKDIEKSILDLQTREAKIPLEVEETERKEFVKTGDEIRNAGADGSTVKNLRKQQIDILRNNPQIAGIMYGKGTQYDNARRFILDSLSGRFSGSEGGAQRADELGKIALNPNEKAALAEFANLTANINQRTLKAASGPGAVSDAEQRANKEANLQYVERLEPMMVVNELFRSQFTSDLAAAKADALNRGQFKTRKEFDSYWNQESGKLTKQYAGIYKARLEMLRPYLEAVQKNPGDEVALQRRRDAIIHSMNVYPAPEYNNQTGKWDYKTDNARKAAMNAALGR